MSDKREGERENGEGERAITRDGQRERESLREGKRGKERRESEATRETLGYGRGREEREKTSPVAKEE